METDSRDIVGPQEGWLGHQNVPKQQRVRLQHRAIALRIAAAGCAVVATALTIGMQVGLVAVYSGELDATLAALKPEPPASRVASACDATQAGRGGPGDAPTPHPVDASQSRLHAANACQ